MTHYETKKQARIERLLKRAEKKQEFADNNDLSLYGEAKSGIPLGQPILVGHHSERRHRRHLARIEAKVRKGYEAGEEASRLREAAASAESRTAIDSDNPEAEELLRAKIEKLEKYQTRMKRTNQLVRKCNKSVDTLAELLTKEWPGEFTDARTAALNLLTPDFAGRIGIPSYAFTNRGVEIRRLKKRLAVQELIADHSNFAPFVVHTHDGDIGVEKIFGQIQVEFPWKPNEATRQRLKTSPLALKWSSYSGRWVRKHTATTASQYFRDELIKALESAERES